MISAKEKAVELVCRYAGILNEHVGTDYTYCQVDGIDDAAVALAKEMVKAILLYLNDTGTNKRSIITYWEEVLKEL